MHDTLSSVQTFLGIISGISLVVAGVGILNIMLVSMMERTREIGIIKLLGAKDRTVLFAFLCECAFIGVLGSIIGIGAGYAVSNWFRRSVREPGPPYNK